ncbi:MAG: ATP-binding protein [Elusimicrobia bacterium]|nr:ATP-binding protein [Elusimicrobiota bacterium]
MKTIIQRKHDIKEINNLLKLFPVTAILGPRQSGKTFLARLMKYNHYFDLENPQDISRLENPQITLEDLSGLIVIDEIQHHKDLFKTMRYLVDKNPKQKYLVLGSASGNLMKQSSESLAGRIGYYHLGGFSISDIGADSIKKLWLRGGLPRSFLSRNDKESSIWLSNYISTFLERDIPQLGITIPSHTLRKFWLMMSHYHGVVLNYSELARSFGISDMTVRKYIDIMEQTFMVRILQPWYANIGKRLVKSPKIYIRDSGILHSLLSIENFNQLSVHNKIGTSWEGFALECISKSLQKKNEELFFWNTHNGAELDLFWQNKGKNWGIEFKYSDAPKITRSIHLAINDLNLSHLWIIYPGKQSYKLNTKVTVIPLSETKENWNYK